MQNLQQQPTKERLLIYPQGITTKKEFIEYSIKNGCKVRCREIMHKKGVQGCIVIREKTNIAQWLEFGYKMPVKEYELYNTGETGWKYHDITKQEYDYAVKLGAQIGY